MGEQGAHKTARRCLPCGVKSLLTIFSPEHCRGTARAAEGFQRAKSFGSFLSPFLDEHQEMASVKLTYKSPKGR